MVDILMSIFDLIPVCLFLVNAIILQRLFYTRMDRVQFTLFSFGTLSVFAAGLLKATYKILLYTNVCVFQTLNTLFFPLQTVGFLCSGFALVIFIVEKKASSTNVITLPVIALAHILAATNEYKGTMLFVALMIAGVSMFILSMIVIAAKKREVKSIVLFSIAFVFILGMGYLSTKEGLSDWYKEGVNSIGQGSFLAGTILLKKTFNNN